MVDWSNWPKDYVSVLQALNIMKVSLTSTAALSDALNNPMLKKIRYNKL